MQSLECSTKFKVDALKSICQRWNVGKNKYRSDSDSDRNLQSSTKVTSVEVDIGLNERKKQCNFIGRAFV